MHVHITIALYVSHLLCHFPYQTTNWWHTDILGNTENERPVQVEFQNNQAHAKF